MENKRPIQIKFQGATTQREIYKITLNRLTEMVQFATADMDKNELHALFLKLEELSAIVQNAEAHATYPGLRNMQPEEEVQRGQNMFDDKPWTIQNGKRVEMFL